MQYSRGVKSLGLEKTSCLHHWEYPFIKKKIATFVFFGEFVERQLLTTMRCSVLRKKLFHRSRGSILSDRIKHPLTVGRISLMEAWLLSVVYAVDSWTSDAAITDALLRAASRSSRAYMCGPTKTKLNKIACAKRKNLEHRTALPTGARTLRETGRGYGNMCLSLMMSPELFAAREATAALFLAEHDNSRTAALSLMKFFINVYLDNSYKPIIEFQGHRWKVKVTWVFVRFFVCMIPAGST